MVLPMSSEDRRLLQKLQDKSWFILLRTYGVFFGALAYLYYRMAPGTYFKGHRMQMSRSDYNYVYGAVALVFGSVFLLFLIRDYRRLVLPLRREMRLGNKYISHFFARKYKDPFYGKCLLFYPGKENLYISISEDDFDAIGNGEELQLDSAVITGEVLALRSGDKVFTTAEEFSFSDMPADGLLHSE
jgi:hypothetical protein